MEPDPRWVERGTPINVTVRAGRAGTGTAVVYRVTIQPGARRKRAVIALCICWGLAIASLPILFLHFFLVPAFLLAGPIFYALRMRESDLILGGIVPCPGCSADNRLGVQAEDWPLGMRCEQCTVGMKLTPE